MQRALLFLLLLIYSVLAKAQYDEKDFVHYTVSDGLSEHYINCIQQDQQGYMWIGTDIGLNRFDGHSFKKFFQGTSTLPLLSSSIRKIKLLDTTKLGILTRGGFQVLNTSDLTVKNFKVPDSTAFTTYRNAAWDAVALPNNAFALSTASGFYVFDKTGNLTLRHDAYQLKDIGQKTIRYGRDFFEINDQEFLVLINNDGLAYYNHLENKFYEIDENKKNLAASAWTNFYPFTPTKNRGLIAHCKLSNDEYVFYHFANKEMLYYNRALQQTISTTLMLPRLALGWESKITKLNDSSFLMNGGYSGFYQFTLDRATGKINMDAEKKLPNHKIQCFYIDKDARLWVGTSKGLLMQKLIAPVVKSTVYKPAITDSITGGFTCAFKYKDKLYLGRFSLNKGLCIVDSNHHLLKQIDFFGKNNPWNEVRSIQMYYPDTLWIGTNAGRLWFDTKSNNYGKLLDEKKPTTGLPGLNVLAPANSRGEAWMCSHLEGLVARYDVASRTFTYFTSTTKPALPFDKVKSIAYDAYGDVWIGGHSLARWNQQKQIFDTLISVMGGPNKYEEDILILIADKRGSLWMHNAYNGLLQYQIKQRRFIHYSMKDGLPSDVFYGFSAVVNNELWMASNNQLTGFNTVTKNVVVYDHQDGLPDEKPSSRYLYLDHLSNQLYLFNQQTLSSISLPAPFIKDYSSELIIEELVVNDKHHFFYPKQSLKFNPDENNLSLHFGIINFEAGNSYQFAYKLKETDNWSELGEQRNINLTGLSSGRYTVWLKGTSKLGIQKIRTFSFVIQTPFWKTTGFLFLSCLLLLSFIYGLYQYRFNQIRQKAELDKQLAQTEMKALHAQMNPHFIFNSLNSIREMILNNENRDASRYLSKFAQLIRITLDQSGQVMVSLRNAIEYLERYIEMEKIRNANFTCAILTDNNLDLDETMLPPMLIQPFIENAIWHGVSSQQKSIHINVIFTKQLQQLVCTIDDDGIGIKQSLHNKKASSRLASGNRHLHNPVGIANIKNRIQLLNEKYKLRSSVTIQDKKEIACATETGTLVTLHLPIEINEP